MNLDFKHFCAISQKWSKCIFHTRSSKKIFCVGTVHSKVIWKILDYCIPVADVGGLPFAIYLESFHSLQQKYMMCTDVICSKSHFNIEKKCDLCCPLKMFTYLFLWSVANPYCFRNYKIWWYLHIETSLSLNFLSPFDQKAKLGILFMISFM